MGKSFGRKFLKDQITSLLEHKSVNFFVQSEDRKNAKGLYLLYLYIYPLDSLERLIHKESNYPDLYPELQKDCCQV